MLTLLDRCRASLVRCATVPPRRDEFNGRWRIADAVDDRPSPAHNRCAPATDSFASRCDDRGLRHRRRLRLRYYDYASSGAYFVTVCTRDRRCTLGEAVQHRVLLSSVGEAVAACWIEIPIHHPSVQLDAFQVMPNHLHGILMLGVGAGYIRPLQTVVGTFKAAVTRRVGRPIWQRSYYERVIRGEDELDALREYIEQNPLRWALDRENPNRL
jgi:putative transposase